jgi:hypothetical protein
MSSITITAEADGYTFEPLNIKLTDEMTEIPQIKAKSINLCG